MLTHLLASRKHHDLLAIIKGIRNGIVYGAKIRFPHALVMTLLFRSGTPRELATLIARATYAHARNLGTFVGLYKTIMLVLSRTGKEHSWHSFIAGLVGGYVVFGEDNNINNQIVLYLFSRVLVGFAKLLASRHAESAAVQSSVMRAVSSEGLTQMKGTVQRPLSAAHHGLDAHSIFAALVWGSVMWLFRHHRQVLQPSLQASMQYLYIDSQHWNSLRNFLWHNK